MSKLMNEEVDKWTQSVDTLMSRLSSMLDDERVELKNLQERFNDVMHGNEFHKDMALTYIKAMNGTLESLKTIENLISQLKISKKD